jgi:hypothetical protein
VLEFFDQSAEFRKQARVLIQILRPRHFGLLACWFGLRKTRRGHKRDCGNAGRTLEETPPLLLENLQESHLFVPPSGEIQDRLTASPLPSEHWTKTEMVLLE